MIQIPCLKHELYSEGILKQTLMDSPVKIPLNQYDAFTFCASHAQ